MPLLCEFAGSVDALAATLGRLPHGSRDPEALFVAVDEVRHALMALSNRMRAGSPPIANDRGDWTGPAVVHATGRGQIIVASARRR